MRFGEREVWVRAYPLPIDHRATRQIAQSARVREFEEQLLRRRRDFLILRVDRADLSKNVLRGFSAFDLFLEQHPEFTERVTFMAQLMPSRTDVPQYAEYLERIEALVAVVNHRHGTPDWMPIQLKLRDDLEEAMAAYKHYDVLLVNAMFDGMNLVAKEGPIVNEREGVSILSENTGAHEELGEYALSVNPFDIQELANSIYAALTMDPRERRRRAEGLVADRHLARPRRLDRRAARGHPRQGRLAVTRLGDTATLLRLSDRMTLPAPTYDLVLLLDTAGARTATRAKIVADTRAADRGAGRAAAPRRLGRAAARLPDRPRKRAPSTTCCSSTRARRELLSGLDRTLRITDGVLRFRIIKLAAGRARRARHALARAGARRAPSAVETRARERRPPPSRADVEAASSEPSSLAALAASRRRSPGAA